MLKRLFTWSGMISSLVADAVAMLPNPKRRYLNEDELRQWQRVKHLTFSTFHSEKKKFR
jgi:hypothetical protein